MAAERPAILVEGSVFHARYQIIRCLKAGGMGAVYEVVHLETKRRRALKVMLPSIVANTEMRSRFKLEATVAADIESEHIVETFDAGVDGETGSPFLVMELLRGEDLASVVEKRGAISADDAVLYLGQAALALERTHGAGVVHRDLKPENMFLTHRDDGSPRVKILDFGIAKVVSESAQTAKQTAAIGTPLYMSPEQIQGDGRIGHRADLYAMGHIAYTLLTGEAYWEEEARASTNLYGLIMKVVAGAQEAPCARASRRGVTVPPAFDAWFARATANVPANRFEGASEQVTALAEALDVRAPRFSTTPHEARGPMPVSPSGAPAAVQSAGPSPRAQSVPAELTHISGGPFDGRTGGRTTSPISSDPIPAPPKRSAVPAILGATSLLVAVVGIGAFTLSNRSEVDGTSRASPSTDSPASRPASATAAAVPSEATSAASQVPEVAPGPSAAVATTSPAPRASSPPVPVGPPRTSAAPTVPSKLARPSCDPPFVVGADGTRRLKPECLK